MGTAENPFDDTIWDPFDSDQAIEDELHGPSAVAGMLETPPMPMGDGTYYQPGAFYAVGTPLFDANGAPVYRIGTARSTQAIMREMLALNEWVDTSVLGEDALTALEATRQRARLDRTGVAHSFKPSDVCAGGQRIDECQTAQTAMTAAQEYAPKIADERPGEGPMWNVLARLGSTCATCSLSCEVAVQTRDGEPTGITRFTNARPLADDFPVVRIDLTA